MVKRVAVGYALCLVGVQLKSLAKENEILELSRRLQSLTGFETPVFGKMSVGQMVCHVGEAFRLVTEQRTLTPGMKFPLPKVAIKWLGLKAPMQWPPNIRTAKELEPGKSGTIPVEFASDRELALAQMLRFCDGVSASDHPYFGRMTRADWLRWGYLHADHHLRHFGR